MSKEPQSFEPGPGRSTSAAAFDQLTQNIARQNEAAHKAARERRKIRDAAEWRKREAWEQESGVTLPGRPGGPSSRS